MRDLVKAVIIPVAVVWLLTGGITRVSAQQPGAAGQQPPLDTPASVYPSGYSPQWIDDSDFVYGPALLDFDLKAYLDGAAPQLSRYAEFISHWCGFYSISPKVLLTVIDMQSGLVSNRSATGSLDSPLAGLIPAVGFEAQVQKALATLSEDFYAFRAATEKGGAPADGAVNASTYSLLNLFRANSSPGAFASSVAAVRSDFLGRYNQLFPPSARRAALREAGGAGPPANLLQLPWRLGQSWYFNGVHTTSGVDPGVMSSIDFTRTWSLTWGADTSTDYVVAAHDGTVTVFSSCSIRVTSPTGWATNYYHLDRVAVASGAHVSANQVLAIYANNLGQALCQGGSSTGPHVHFSLLNNGVLVPLDGASLSNFVVHGGRFSYDSDPSYMWLDRNGTRFYAYAAPIAAPLAPVPAPPAQLTAFPFGSSLTLTWIAPAVGSAPSAYFIEAGSSSGRADLAAFSTETNATIFSTTGVPAGTYYVRVRATNAGGASSPSNEAVVVIGGSCAGSPGAPGNLRVVSIIGATVTLVWAPAAGSASSYLVEAASTPGAATVNSDLGSAATSLVVTGVARGVYYARIRARNACGVGPVSNEVIVNVS